MLFRSDDVATDAVVERPALMLFESSNTELPVGGLREMTIEKEEQKIIRISSTNGNIYDAVNNVASISRGPRSAMSGEQVAKDEKRAKKLIVRAISGFGLITVFSTCIYMGHVYVCGIVALSQFLLFRELVKVRYNAYFHTIQGGTIPLFRTTQWTWFCVAIFYTYGDFITEVVQSNPEFYHHIVPYIQYLNTVAFMLYSVTFVLTIATMQVGHI